MNTPDVRWSVVTGDRARVENYLYAHTVVIAAENDGFGELVMTVTSAFNGNAQYLADYQAGRLQSGGMRTHVFATFPEAVAHFHETFAARSA